MFLIDENLEGTKTELKCLDMRSKVNFFKRK